MSNPDFIRAACTLCGGHLEFPADAIGQTMPCPHCGWPIELSDAESHDDSPAKTGLSRRKRLAIAVALCVCTLVAAFILLTKPANHAGSSQLGPHPAAPILPSTPIQAKPAALPEPKPKAETNDFAVMSYKLEKLSGSSLVYVTGTVRNLSDHQRFGVKLAFNLFDADNNPVGSATDYKPTLDARATWHFKAMVMTAKSATARFDSIADDK